jgi:monoamine oxidase
MITFRMDEIERILKEGDHQMNLNSQFSYDPPQPDNPSDAARHFLSRYALAQKGWPEDFDIIMKYMSPPPDITNYSKPGGCRGLTVGVIGGGLAGLSAAYELRKLGFDITIYDALEDRIGGRIYTYYFDQQENLYNEIGAMRIPAIHETVWHYINLFKLPTRPFIQNNPNTFVVLKNTRVRNDLSGANIKRHIYPKYHLNDWEKTISWQKLQTIGIDTPLFAATPEERSEIIQVKPQYHGRPLAWSDHTSFELMQSEGLSQDAIQLISSLQPVLRGNLFSSYIDYIEESYPADTGFVYEIPGGMSRLPMAFFNSLMASSPYQDIDKAAIGTVTYRAGYWVSGIVQDSNGGKVKLKSQHLQSGTSTEENFDYVVCAIPFSTLKDVAISPLFSSIKMRAIREVHYAPAQKSLLLCRERFWEQEGIVGGGTYTDLPISSVWYPSDHAKFLTNPNDFASDFRSLPWNEPGVIVSSYNLNANPTTSAAQTEESDLAPIERELSDVHGLTPEYLHSIVEDFKILSWDKQPTFRGALSFFTPGQKELFAYGMALPEYNGKIFFAGEHISGTHRWMQGALQTGMQAANDLADTAAKNIP